MYDLSISQAAQTKILDDRILFHKLHGANLRPYLVYYYRLHWVLENGETHADGNGLSLSFLKPDDQRKDWNFTIEMTFDCTVLLRLPDTFSSGAYVIDYADRRFKFVSN